MDPLQYAILAVLAIGVLSGPLTSENYCSFHCKDDNKFGYEKGHSYVYEYTVETMTSMREDESDESRLHLTATAELTKVSSCDFKLQLQDVRLLDSNSMEVDAKRPVSREREFRAALENYPLYFSYVDGKIADICTPSDLPWVVNIKRGLLSTLQHTLDDLSNEGDVMETDINGNCKTEYKVNKGWKSMDITKTKNLLSCTKRQHKISPLQSTQYTSHSDIQSLPILTSHMECQQSVDQRIITKALCQEKHEFKPFSNDSIKARATSTQSLIFQKKLPHKFGYRNEEERFKTSLLFDHMSTGFGNLQIGIDSVKAILGSLETQTKNQVSKETPRLFSSLIVSMRGLTFSELKAIYNKGSKATRKYFSDALPMVGSPASIEMIFYLSENEIITEEEMNFWYTSLAFTSRPTREMITALEPFLRSQPKRQALLGISALINQYCTYVDDCHHDSSITSIVKKITKLLGSSCRVSSEEDKAYIITVLKAIGNIGISTDNTDTLEKCYKESNPIEVRIAAMDAWRRMPCGFGKRDHLIRFFLDQSQDSELRIGAYLAMMKCPDIDIMTSVRSALTREPVNQVGSFVWTHLTNLQETSDPTKASIRELVGSKFLKNKFNTDARKFSRNFEGSTFWNKYNIGAQAESNVIFSTKSYLPRSAMFNFTVHLFGEAVNLFEIGGRAEGFESMIENLFGKTGYFPEENVKHMLEEFRGKEPKSNLGELINIFKQTTDNDNDPHASGYIRMFGNDLIYGTLNDAKKISLGSFMDQMTKFFSQKTIDFTKASKFIDVEYSIPMSTGFPLHLQVNGTATMKLKAKGKMDTENFLSNYDMDISGHFVPSAAIELSMQMKIDANVAYTGIELSTSMSSRSALDGHLTLKNGKVLSAALSAPEERVEIFDFSSNLMIHRKGERHTYMKSELLKENKMCSGWFLDKFFGLKLCGVVEHKEQSQDSVALSGPVNVKLYLEKVDTFSEYQLDYNFENGQEKKLEFKLDTPGSETSRKFHSVIVAKPEQSGHSISARLQTPGMKTWDVSGSYEYNEDSKAIGMTVKKENTELLKIRSYLRSEKTSNIVRIEPYLHISSSGVDLVKVQGNLAAAKQRKFSSDLTISHISEKPIKLTGHLDMIPRKVDFDVNIDSSFIVTAVSGSINTQSKSPKLTLRMTYQTEGTDQQTINFYGKFSDTSSGRLKSYGAFWELTHSAYPNFNIQINWESQYDIGKYFDNKISVLQSESQTVWTSEQLISLKSNPTDYSVIVSLTCPQKSIDYRFELSHKFNEEEMLANLIARLSPSEEISAKCVFNRESGPLFYNGIAEMKYPGKIWKASGHIKESIPNSYESELTVDLARGAPIKIKGNYRIEDDSVTLNQEGNIQVIIPEMPEIQIEGKVFGGHGESKLAVKTTLDRKSYGFDMHVQQSKEHKIHIEAYYPEGRYKLESSYIREGRNVAGSLDLIAGRHISINGKVNDLRDGITVEIEGFFDKTHNAAARYALKGKLTTSQIGLSAEIPRGVYALEGSTTPDATEIVARSASGEEIRVKLMHKLESTDIKLGASVSTPFRGYTLQKIEAQFQLIDGSMNGELAANWRANKYIKISVSGLQDMLSSSPSLRGQGVIKSSELAQDIEFAVNMSTEDEQKTLAVEANYAGKKYALSGNFAQRSKYLDVKADLKFQSPFKNFKEGSLSILMMKKKRESKMEIKGSMESHRFGLGYEGKYKYGSEVHLKVVGHSSLERFNSFEVMVAGNMKKDSTYAGKVHLMFNQDITVTLTTEGKYSMSRTTREIETFNKLTSSFLGDYSVHGEMKNDRKKYSTKITAKWGDQGEVSATLVGERISPDELRGQLTVSGMSHSMFATVSHKKTDNTFRTLVKGKLDNEDLSITATGNYNQMSRSGSKMDLSIDLSFPWLNINGGKFAVSRLVDDKNVYHTIEAMGNNQKFSASQQWKTEKDSIWENLISLETPYSEVSKIYLKNRHDGQNKLFAHDMEGSWNDNQMFASANLDRNSRNSKSWTTAGVSLKTPFTDELNFDLKHEMNDNEVSPMMISLRHGDKLMTISGKAKLGFSDGVVSVEANIPEISPITANLKYDLAESKTGSLIITKGSEEVVVFELNGNLRLMKSDAFAKLTVLGVHQLRIDLDYDLEKRDKSILVKFDYNGQETSIEGIYPASDGTEMELKLKTPFDGFTLLMGKILFEKQPSKLEITMQKESKTASVSLQWKLTPSEGDLKARAQTPFDGYQDISVDLSYLGRYGGHQVQGVVKTAGEEYKITYSTVMGKSDGTLSLVIETPFSTFKHYKLNAKYDLNQYHYYSMLGMGMSIPLKGKFELVSDFSPRKDNIYRTSAEFDMESVVKSLTFSSQKGSGIYKLDVKGQFNRDEMTITLEGTTPFQAMRTFSSTVKYDLRNPTKHAQVETSINGQSNAYSGKIRYEPKEIEATLRTPHYGYEKLHFLGSLDELEFGNKYNVRTGINNDIVEMGLEYGASDKHSGKLHVKTPFSGKHFGLNGQISPKYISVSAEHGDQTVSLDMNYEYANQRGQAQLTLLTPFADYERIELQSTFSLSRKAKSISIQFKMPNNRITLEGNYEKEKTKHVLSASFDVDQIIDGSLKLSLAKANGRYSSMIDMKLGHHEARLESYLQTNKDKELSVTFSTPSKSYDFNFNGKIKLDNKHTMLVGSVKTEIEGLEALGFESTLISEGSDKKEITLMLTKNDAIFKTTASFERRREGESIALAINFPAETIDDVIIRYSRHWTPKSKLVDCELKQGSKSYKLKTEISQIERNNYKLHANIETPLKNWKQMEITGGLDLSSKRQMEFAINKGDTFLNTIVKFERLNDNEYQVDFNFASSYYRDYESSSGLKIKLLDDGLSIAGNVRIGELYSMTINSKLGIGKSHILITSNIPDYEKIEVDWRANVESKQIVISGTVNKENEQVLELKVNSKYRSLTNFKGEALLSMHDGKKAFEVDWTSNLNDLRKASELQFRLVSPYVKNILAKIKYALMNEKQSFEAMVNFGEKKMELMGDLGLYSERKVMSGKIQLLSTLAFRKTFSVSGKYDLLSTKKSVDLHIENDYDKFTMVGKYDSADQSFDFFMTTPFAAIKDLTIDCNRRNNVYTGKLLYNQVYELIGTFGFSPENAIAELKLNTPRWRNIEITLQKTSNSIPTIELHMRMQSKKFNMIVSYNTDNYLDAKVDVTGNIWSTKDYSINGQYSTRDNKISVVFENGRRIDISGDIQMSLQHSKASLLFTSPFRGYESIQLSGMYKKTKTALTSDLNAGWGESTINVNVKGDLRENAGSGMLSIKTPFQQLKTLEIEGDYEKVGDKYVANGKAKVSENYKIEFRSDISSKGFSASLETPFELLRNINAQGNIRSAKNRFDVTSEVTVNKNSMSLTSQYIKSENKHNMKISTTYNQKSIQLDAYVRLDSFKSMEITLNINTPFKHYQTMNVEMSYTIASTMSRAAFKITGLKSETWEGKFALDVSNREDMSLKLNLITPIEELSDIALTLNGAPPSGSRGTFGAFLKIDESVHKMVFKYELSRENTFRFTLNSDLLPSESLKVSGHFDAGSNRLAASIKVEISDTVFENSIRYVLSSNKIEFEASDSIMSPFFNADSAHIKLEGELENYQPVKIQSDFTINFFSKTETSGIIYHKTHSSANNLEIALTFNRMKDSHTISFGDRKESSDRTVTLRVDSPWLRGDPLNVEATFNSSSKTGKAVVNIFGEEHSATGSFKSLTQGKITLKSQIIPKETVTLTYNFKYASNPTTSFTGDLVLRALGESGKVSVVFERQLGKFEGSVKSTSSLEQFKNNMVKFVVNMENALDVYGVAETTIAGFEKTEVTAKFDKSITGSIDIKTSMPGYEYISALVNIPLHRTRANHELTIKTPQGDYSFSGTYTYANNQITFSGEGLLDGKKINFLSEIKFSDVYEINLVLETPFSGYETYKCNMKARMLRSDASDMAGEIEINGQKIVLDLNMKSTPQARHFILEMKTPFEHHELYGMYLRFENSDRKTIQAEMKLPKSSVGFAVDYYFKNMYDFVMKGMVSFPFQDATLDFQLVHQKYDDSYNMIVKALSTFEVSTHVQGTKTADGFEALMDGNIFEQSFKTKAIFKNEQGHLLIDFLLKTPFELLKELTAVLKGHTGKDGFDSQAMISYNSNTLVNMEMFSKDGKKVIELRNPIFPFAVSYIYNVKGKIVDLRGELSWDLYEEKPQTIGAMVLLKSKATGRTIKVVTSYFTNVVELHLAYDNTSNRMKNVFSVGLNKSFVGYDFSFFSKAGNSQGSLKILNPIKALSLEYTSKVTRGLQKTDFYVVGEKKMMGIVIEKESDSSFWSSTKDLRSKITLIYPVEASPVIIEIRKFGTNGNLFGGMSAKITLEDETLIHLAYTVSKFNSDLNEGKRLGITVFAPSMTWDSELNIAWAKENSKYQVQLTGRYMDSQRQIHTLNEKLFFDFSSQQAVAKFIRNGQNYIVTLNTETNESGRKLVIEYLVDGDKQMMSEIVIRTTRPLLTILLQVSPHHTIHIDAGLHSNREMGLKVRRNSFGREISDVNMLIKLNSKHALRSSIHWRPEIKEEISKKIGEFLEHAEHVWNIDMHDHKELATREFQERYQLGEVLLSKVWRRYQREIDQDLSNLKQTLESFTNTMNNAYYRNTFYCQDMVGFLFTLSDRTLEMFDFSWRGISSLYNTAAEHFTSYLVKLCSVLDKTKSTMVYHISQFIRSHSRLFATIERYVAVILDSKSSIIRTVRYYIREFSDLWENNFEELDKIIKEQFEIIETTLNEFLSAWSQNLKDFQDEFRAMLTNQEYQIEKLVDGLKHELSSYTRMITSHSFYKAISDFYQAYGSWLEEFHTSDLVDMLMEKYQSSMTYINGSLQEATKSYSTYITALTDAVQGKYQKVREIPPVAYVVDSVDKLYRQVNSFVEFMEINKNAQGVLTQTVRDAKAYLMELFSEAKKLFSMAGLKLRFQKDFAFKPEEGRITYTQYLPFEWHSFEEMPSIDFSDETSMLDKLISRIDLTGKYYQLVDMLQRSHTFSWSKIVPPFGTTAMLAGSQHYMTFDKKYFEFSGDCSYLLAYDYTDRNFSAVVNYEGANGKIQKKSLTVTTNEYAIEISSNFKVTVNGKIVNLPLSLPSTFVKREGSKILVHDAHGINIECNLPRDICTLAMSGWYYGKTAGLFGTYNNEASDDFMTPMHDIKPNVESFAYSWKVGTTQCKAKNYALEGSKYNRRAYESCRTLFENDDSVFRPCFTAVDPKPYFNMCMNDMEMFLNEPESELGTCTASSAYVTSCKLQGVDIWMPPTCIRCQLEDGHVLISGENKTFQNDAPMSSDVVLIIEHKKCTADYPIAEIAMKIDTMLEQSGIVNNKFAVIGFGGKGLYEEPHTHTFHDKIWISSSGVGTIVKTIHPQNGENEFNIYQALRYGLNLPFRAGVSKNFILLACGSCNHNQMPSEYADMWHLMAERDVKLHVISPDAIHLKSAKKVNKIIGFDMNVAYTTGDVKNLEGDASLRQQIDLPKDYCTPLAIETSGSLFSFPEGSASKKLMSTKAVTVLAKRIAQTSIPSECQHCECVADRDDVGVTRCSRCVSAGLNKFIQYWEKLSYDVSNSEEVSPISFVPRHQRHSVSRLI